MSKIDYSAIAEMPEYQALVAKRKALTWPLLLLTMVIYFSFILTIAFVPEALSGTVGSGVISVGLMVGMGVIFATFAITGIYVYQANHSLEKLTDEIHRKLENQ